MSERRADDRASGDVPAPRQITVAGALVVLQGLLGVGFAVALALRTASNGAAFVPLLGESAYFVLIGGGLAAVGVGLLRGKRWPRTPAIVAQLLLLPVVYSLIGPSGQIALGILAGALVFATFMLLISEPVRLWHMGMRRR